ncbi:MAG: type 4a pilus biogenesis protein PilO [Phycisphaerales bacterium]|nr:type 4a pilus biogenesis protein PilO [Phycisphaerales bacterium]
MKSRNQFDWRVEGVFVVAWAVLGAATYFGGVAPEARARRAAVADMALIAVQERELETIRAKVRDTRRGLEQAEKAREQAPVRLRRASEINERLARISGIGESAGVKIDQLEPEKPAPFGRYAVVPIRISGIAGYAGLAGLIRRLHIEFPDTAARGFKLSALQEAGSANGRFTIDLAWYTAPETGQPAR